MELPTLPKKAVCISFLDKETIVCEYLSEQKDVCLVQQTNEEVAKFIYTGFLTLNFLTLMIMILSIFLI